MRLNPFRRTEKRHRTLAQLLNLGSPTRATRSWKTFWDYYAHNELVYAATMDIVNALLDIEWLTEGWRDEEQRWARESETHPLAERLANPHPYMDSRALFERFWLELLVTGNSFLYKQRSNAGEVNSLWPLDTRKVGALHTNGNLEAYLLLGEGQAVFSGRDVYYYKRTKEDKEIPFGDIVRLTVGCDPDFPLWGMSPYAAAIDAIDTDMKITDFVSAFFENGAVPAYMFTTKTELDDDQIKKIERRWRSRHGSPEKAWSLAVIDGTEGSLERLGLATGSREIGLTELRKTIEARILAALNVPPIIVGAVVGLEHATYSNYGQSLLAFHQEGVHPILNRGSVAFTSQLAPDFATESRPKLRVRPDTSRSLALEEYRRVRDQRVTSGGIQGFYTQNEVRAELDKPPLAGGDVVFVPVNVAPVPSEVIAAGSATSLPITTKRIRRLAKRLTKPGQWEQVIEEQIIESLHHTKHDGEIAPELIIEQVRPYTEARQEEGQAQRARRLLMTAHVLTIRAINALPNFDTPESEE